MTAGDAQGSLPSYASLPLHEALGMRHAWGVFGPDDELGTVGLLTDACAVAGATEVREGRKFNLSMPLNLPNPPWSAGRGGYRHDIFELSRNTQDDVLDNFYLQGSTQWDGLRHIGAREFGFYNGVSAEEAGSRGSKLGIELWSRHGVVGRGVLLDVAGYCAAQGDPLPVDQGRSISCHVLAEVAEHQGVVMRPGDILLVRTGYVDAYLSADHKGRQHFRDHHSSPGLLADEEMAAYLWDLHIAALALDNPAVEVVPGDPSVGYLHRRLIPMLGMALGEFFRLGELADHCRADGRFTCMFVAAPLNLPGGVGSPANAIAIK